jgi:hypothetical protein
MANRGGSFLGPALPIHDRPLRSDVDRLGEQSAWARTVAIEVRWKFAPVPENSQSKLIPEDPGRTEGPRSAARDVHSASRGSSRPRDHQTDHLETPHHSPPTPFLPFPSRGRESGRGGGFPELYGAVIAGRGESPAVRAEGDRGDPAGMSPNCHAGGAEEAAHSLVPGKRGWPPMSSSGQYSTSRQKESPSNWGQAVSRSCASNY